MNENVEIIDFLDRKFDFNDYYIIDRDEFNYEECVVYFGDAKFTEIIE